MSEDTSQFTGTPDPLTGGNVPPDPAYDPSQQSYPDDSYSSQQDSDTSGQIQPVSTGGISPEVPISSETGEQIVQPEVHPEMPVTSETKSDKGEISTEKKEITEERIDSPKQEPNEYVFESPFSVYGYQASKKTLDQARKGKGRNSVTGDVDSARTWLLVLLGKLIKLRK
jgi:hypothetical protein